MTQPAKLNVNPAVLRWARQRASLEIADLEHKVSEEYGSWETGEVKPTLRQLETMAKETKVAIGRLFLSEPPKEDRDPITDFRTIGSAGVLRPGPDLLDTIYHCQDCQDWYRDYLRSVDADRLDFIGSVDVNSDVELTARKIRAELDQFDRTSIKSREAALNQLADAIEDIGVMVMINGHVGNSTARKLSTKEFRGFALSDEYAPLIFVNGQDSRAAQIFTLAHELAHLWLGESGISDCDQDSQSEVEKWCIKVAARTLVPTDELMLADTGELRIQGIAGRVSKLSMHFKVSTLVIIIRLLDAGRISPDAFRKHYSSESKRQLKQDKAKAPVIKNSAYHTMRKRHGKIFSSALISDALSGNTLYRDALRLLYVESVSALQSHARLMEGKK